jgi:hypothetical protein
LNTNCCCCVHAPCRTCAAFPDPYPYLFLYPAPCLCLCPLICLSACAHAACCHVCRVRLCWSACCAPCCVRAPASSSDSAGTQNEIQLQLTLSPYVTQALRMGCSSFNQALHRHLTTRNCHQQLHGKHHAVQGMNTMPLMLCSIGKDQHRLLVCIASPTEKHDKWAWCCRS